MKRLFEIIFWTGVSLVLFIVFGESYGNYTYSFYFLVFFLPFQVASAYIFSAILIPKYLLKGQYAKFLLYTFYLLVISADIELVLVFLAFMLISLYDIENIGFIISNFRLMPVIMYFIMLLYGFIHIVQQYMSRQNLPGQEELITFRSERKNWMVKPQDILFIESMSDYILVYLENGTKLSTREKISHMEQRLGKGFMRIHRSYLVNMQAVNGYTKESISLRSHTIPISRTYKNEVLEFLDSTIL